MLRTSIQRKLIAAFLLLFGLLAVLRETAHLFGVPFTPQAGRLADLRVEAVQDLNRMADLKRDHVLRWVRERMADGAVIASNVAVAEAAAALRRPGPAAEKARQGLARFFAGYREYSVYHRSRIVDAGAGIVLFSTEAADLGEDLSDRAFFRNALASRHNYVGPLEVQSAGADPVLLFCQVIDDPQGNVQAVLVLDVSADEILTPLLYSGEDSDKPWELILVDQEARPLTALRKPLPDGTAVRPLGPPLQGRIEQLAAAGQEGFTEGRDYAGAQVWAAFRHIRVSSGWSWGLVVKRDQENILAPLRAEALLSLGLGLAGLALVVGLATAMAGAFTRPIRALAQAASRVAAGDLSAEVRVSSRDEVGVLAAAFNSMLGQLQAWQRELGAKVEERTRDLNLANDRLRESEEKLRGIFDTVRSGIILVDARGEVVFANARMAELFGCGLDRIVGSPYLELTHRSESMEAKANIQALIAGRLPAVSLERLYRRKDGTTFWGHLAGARLHRPDGSFWALVGAITDITESRRAQEEIQSLALFPAENPNPVLRISRDGAILYANKAGQALLGRWGAGLRGALPAELASLFAGVLDSAKPRMTELTVAESTFLAALAPFPERGYVNAYIVDITSRKRAEATLRESDEKYRLLFDAAMDPILVADAETGILVECNVAAVEYFGRPRSELLGLHQSALHPAEVPINGSSPEFRRFLADPGRLQEVEVLAAGGRRRAMSVRAGVFEFQGRRFILGVFRDISAAKATSEQMRQAKEAAEAANRAKGEFLANMSHELRTPLNGVLGILQLLDAMALDGEQKVLLETALESGRGLLNIINDILYFAQIEAGKIAIAPEALSPRAILDSLYRAFRYDAQSRGLTWSVNVDDSVPARVLGDGGRLRQVLFNLLGNAFKFTESGRVAVFATALPVCPAPGEVVLLFSVEDTGIGIPEEKIAAVFEPFTQVDGSLTRKYQGTGIGLGIVRSLVRLMGGDVAVETEPGVGTTMHFTVRCGLLPEETTVDQVRDAARGADFFGLRVLLAEDDRVNRFTATRFLERLGCEVAVAENGRQAVDMLRAEDFDVVIMDIQMPEMDGVQATRAIRADSGLGDKARIPVLAMTAHAMPGDREQFLAAGMDGYIAKPVDMDELVRVLSAVMWR